MELIEKKLSELIPYTNNPRKNDGAVDAVMESIKQCGYISPIVIDENNEILAGHTRYKAMKKLKIKTAKCVVMEGLTEEQKRKYRILDNKTGEFAEWDIDLLNIELEGLDFEGFDFGFDIPEEEEEKEIIEDEVPEVDETVEPTAKLGDIWQLGRHRLMCGDSTDKETVEMLMNGEKAQMTFSDAPYNISFKGSMSNTTVNGVMVKHKGANQLHDKIHNDCMSKEEFYDFMCAVLSNIKMNVTGAWYLSFSSVNLEELLNPLRDNGMDWKSIIIWMKNQATLSMKDYKSRYEPIVYGRFDNTFYGEKAKEEDIWEYQRTLKNDLHPTMKPIPLICNMIQKSSKKNNNVLDLFGGSGSTLIACEQLDRNCYMMELDPKYVDVIIKRWEDFTGEKAVLLNG